jgi:hypothetical protein
MTDLERNYMDAVRALNSAAYAALRAAKDTEALPMINRALLRSIAKNTDSLVDAGLETAVEQ